MGKPTSTIRNWSGRLLVLIFYGLVAVFIYWQLQSLPLVKLKGLDLRWDFLIAGITIAIGHRFLYPLVWAQLLSGMGAQLQTRWRSLYRVYSDSWVGRYIPGKVAMLGARILFAERLGIGRYQATVSFAVEYLIQAVVWISISIYGLLYSKQIGLLDPFLPYLYIAPLLALLVLYPPILNRLTRLPIWIYHRKNRQELDQLEMRIHLDLKTLLKAASIHTFTCFFYILEGWCIVSAVQPILQFEQAVLAGAIFPIAVVLGMAVLFAPAGIGAREPLQLLALQSLALPGLAIVMVVLHRSVELLADLIFWFSCRLLKWRWD